MTATVCPGCGADHDPEPCRSAAALCDCCAAIDAAAPPMPYFADDGVTLYHGQALDVVRALPDASVDCCVTSPPYYGLRDYGVDGQIGLEATPAEYVETLRELFAEVGRVLTHDGTLWLNLGDSYSGKANGGESFDRHRGAGHRAGVVAAQRNTTATAPYKSLLGIPWRVALALIDDGWILRNAIVWHKPNAMPESVVDRLNCRYEHVFLFTRSPRYYFELDEIREAYAPATEDRYRYEYQAGGATNDAQIKGTAHLSSGGKIDANPLGRNPGDVWSITTKPFAGAHFATMPLDLAERCIAAGCEPHGTVLDVFSGSGTTGLAASRLGRRYVGIDLNADYLDLSLRTRLAQPALLAGAE